MGVGTWKDDWELSAVVPIFKGKGDAMSCMAYVRGVKLLEHAMKTVEKMLERRLRRMVKVDKMKFGFMPDKGAIDAVFNLGLQEYLDKEKNLYKKCASLTWRRHLTGSQGKY